MSFKYDVFISYRHIDNQTAFGSVGWIDAFENELKNQLAFKLGYEPEIWRDPEIRGNDYFEQVIMRAIEESKIFISILSPGYINPSSEWCLRELREFVRLAPKNIGVKIGDKSRCIKAVKTFVPREQHPLELQELPGFEFFDKDPLQRRPRDFSHLPDGYQHNRYLDRIEQISFDVAALIEAINKQQPVGPTGPAVYLAETTSDRSEYRDSIQNELRSRGYSVLPDEDLPETAAAYRETVKNALAKSVLSVHLIGSYYGPILEGEENKSVIDIQNELAAQRSMDDPNFARVIWIGPDVVPTGNYNPKFVNLLKTDQQAQKGAEVIERSFEELKNRIIEKLTLPKQAGKLLQFPPLEDLVRIYLMCDNADFSCVREVRDYLFDKKYEVMLPPRADDDGQAILLHKAHLLECDAVLIFYGSGSEFWQYSKLIDLRKAAGWGREKPLLCKAIYLASPETEYKRDFRTWEAIVLNPPAYGGLATDALEEFIACIEAAKAQKPQSNGGAR